MQQKFCVKFSEYCKCSKCDDYRNGIERKKKMKSEPSIVASPERETFDKCLPFSHIYANKSSKEFDRVIQSDANDTMDTRGDTAMEIKTQDKKTLQGTYDKNTLYGTYDNKMVNTTMGYAFNSIMSNQTFKDPLNAPLLRETLKKKMLGEHISKSS